MFVRAKYYGTNNFGIPLSLRRAEDIINSFDPNKPKEEINDILEYYNVIQLFDKELFLPEWDEGVKRHYIEVVKQLKAVIGRYFHTITGKDINPLYEQAENNYKEDFLAALSKYKVVERITSADFASFLDRQPGAMSFVLQIKELVNKYGQVISNQLTSNVAFAELVIRHYYVKKEGDQKQKTYIPSELKSDQQEAIIREYVEWEGANLNYLQLIAGQKKAGEHPIDDRIRLKAHKRVQQFWKDNFQNEGSGLKIGVEITIANQEEIVKEERGDDGIVCRLSYSKKWIADNLDYPTLLNNFIYLFGYVDKHNRCQFLSRPNDLGAIERMIGVHGNGEYPKGVGYESMRMKSSLQMYAYQKELRKYNIEIESLFKWFFEEYLKLEFGIEGYCYHVPSTQSSNLEKILLIASQLDAVLKQYKLFVENGIIDRELFEFSSNNSKIVDAPSIIEKKYIYPIGTGIKRDMFCLFSDQCLLNYTQKTKEKYNTFAELLACENITIADYPDYDHVALKELLDRDIIFTDEKGFLRIKKSLFHVLFDMYYYGCVSYPYCTKNEKKLIQTMLEQKEVEIESSLFTRQEKDYLDYILNVQQFINGPEIRNRYVHGNFPQSKDIHHTDYIELLKIMTLIIIKINEEFNIKYPSNGAIIEMVSDI